MYARGDALGWVSIICTHASGATSTASLCCAAAGEGKTEIEVFGRRGTASYDGKLIDYRAWPVRLRESFAAVAGGAPHGANVDHALHLQQLIAQIEAQLR